MFYIYIIQILYIILSYKIKIQFYTIKLLNIKIFNLTLQ